MRTPGAPAIGATAALLIWAVLCVAAETVPPGIAAGVATLLALVTVACASAGRDGGGRLARGAAFAGAFEVGTLLAVAGFVPGLRAGFAAALVVAAAAGAAMAITAARDRGLARGVLVVQWTPAVVAILAAPGIDRPTFLVATSAAVALGAFAAKAVGDAQATAARHTAAQAERTSALEHLSVTDGLTGIANRLHFDRCLEAAWEHAVRRGGQISVLLIDLDHFKRLNDAYGHPFGDACLQAVGAALESTIKRGNDLVARFGGEEFVLLLPNAGVPAALQVAERARRAVATIELAHGGHRVPLTCSVGAATMRPAQTGDPAAVLVHRADAALYEAKAAGRDRVSVAAGNPAASAAAS